MFSAFSSGKLVQYTGNLASITSFANFVTRHKSSSVTEAYKIQVTLRNKWNVILQKALTISLSQNKATTQMQRDV